MSSREEYPSDPPEDPRLLSHGQLLGVAVLLSIALFLSVRLVALRVEGDRRATAATPSAPAAAAATGTAATPAALRSRPPSSPEAFAALVEAWRRAWAGKDVDGYLGFYARTFGSQGKDFAAWAEHKRDVFANDAAIEVEIRDLDASVRADIALLTFIQIYRSGSYSDRGEKRLYLVAEEGAWRIFNEEWRELTD